MCVMAKWVGVNLKKVKKRLQGREDTSIFQHVDGTPPGSNKKRLGKKFK